VKRDRHPIQRQAIRDYARGVALRCRADFADGGSYHEEVVAANEVIGYAAAKLTAANYARAQRLERRVRRRYHVRPMTAGKRIDVYA
jgi:hypothetical protein